MKMLRLVAAVLLVTMTVTPARGAENKENVMNILIIGTDERSESFSDNARSDCMILASLNPNTQTVKLVSLERGMGVPILRGEHKGEYDWLTHVFRYGGAELLVDTVEHCFGVKPDGYVRFNFSAVKKAVDAVGGIDVELTKKEADYFNENLEGSFVKGVNHLSGDQALSFARLRAIDSDWQRVERQRKVIIATVKAVKNSGLPKLAGLAKQLLPLVQTNLNARQMAQLMVSAPRLLGGTFSQLTLPAADTYTSMACMGGRSAYEVDFPENQRILRRFLYGE